MPYAGRSPARRPGRSRYGAAGIEAATESTYQASACLERLRRRRGPHGDRAQERDRVPRKMIVFTGDLAVTGELRPDLSREMVVDVL